MTIPTGNDPGFHHGECAPTHRADTRVSCVPQPRQRIHTKGKNAKRLEHHETGLQGRFPDVGRPVSVLFRVISVTTPSSDIRWRCQAPSPPLMSMSEDGVLFTSFSLVWRIVVRSLVPTMSSTRPRSPLIQHSRPRKRPTPVVLRTRSKYPDLFQVSARGRGLHRGR